MMDYMDGIFSLPRRNTTTAETPKIIVSDFKNSSSINYPYAPPVLNCGSIASFSSSPKILNDNTAANIMIAGKIKRWG